MAKQNPRLGAVTGRGQRIANYEKSFNVKCVDTMGKSEPPVPDSVEKAGNACLLQIRQALKHGVSRVNIHVGDQPTREYIEQRLSRDDRKRVQLV